MRAHARVVAEHHAGATRLTTLRSAPPLTLRDTPAGLHLVGSAASPVGGDDLRLDVEVGPGARLVVRSVAASLALPSPVPSPSMTHLDVVVGPGGHLSWLPQATILGRGCDHRASAHVHLAEGSGLVWREELVLGRWREATGSILSRLRVDLGGAPLIRHDLALGPAWPGTDSPAVLHGARAVGSLLVVGAERPTLAVPEVSGVRLEVMALDGPAVWVLVVEQRPGALGPALDVVTAALGAVPLAR